MSYVNPSVADFKTKFARDFPFGTSTATVMDSDIASAFSDAEVNLNPELFESQSSYTAGYLLLSV